MGKNYTCAVTKLLATARGFGTDFVADAPRVVDEENAIPIIDLIVEHLEERNSTSIDTTQPHKHGRVIERHHGEFD